MRDDVVSICFIFAVALFGILVDCLYLRFARRNPALGSFRKNDGGCGCSAAKEACNSGSCDLP